MRFLKKLAFQINKFFWYLKLKFFSVILPLTNNNLVSAMVPKMIINKTANKAQNGRQYSSEGGHLGNPEQACLIIFFQMVTQMQDLSIF